MSALCTTRGNARVIGPDASFNNTPNVLVWVGDHELVAIPPQDADTTSASASPLGRSFAMSCSAVYDAGRQCAIVIDLHATPVARIITLALPRGFLIESAGWGSAPDTLLVAAGPPEAIYRFLVRGGSASMEGRVGLAGSPVVVAFSPDGRQLHYLRHHGPVQLWTGTLRQRALVPGKELLANADLGFASW